MDQRSVVYYYTSTKNNNTGEQEQTEYPACALQWNEANLAALALLAQ
jgi:hypothetical protein